MCLLYAGCSEKQYIYKQLTVHKFNIFYTFIFTPIDDKAVWVKDDELEIKEKDSKFMFGTYW